ncbi:MAG TPA: DJ-1/PfpI family protein, partial [Methanomassiliicoccales archaeon]|nr:DJ-1/PfpI family protein [Methanomassiliicoccales archaeon]
AAICGGPTHLAQAGVLKGKRFTTTVFKEHEALFDGATYVDENVVVDGNIVTAWPNAYVDFAFQLADMLHIFKDEAERDWAVRQFKLFQRG